MESVCVSLYQWLACAVPLVFGSSEQQSPGQDVESLSASLGAVVHLTTQKPEKTEERSERTGSHS